MRGIGLRTIGGYVVLSLLALAVLYSLAGPVANSAGESNLYALQADAWLQGRMDLQQHYHDTAVFQGRYYVPFPPFPALLVTPIVRLAGLHRTNMVAVSIALAIGTAWVLWRIFQKLQLPTRTAVWLLVGFFLGTSYWGSVIMSNGVWFTAHIVSALCLLLAIDEALGRQRGLRVGLFLGCAFLSRQFSIFYAPFLGALLWWRSGLISRQKARLLLGLMLGIGICGLAYLWFNWARFGNPFDTGYNYLRLSGWLKERFDRHGLFSTKYVWFNLYEMFVQGMHVDFGGPMQLSGWERNPFGTSLIVASPFLLLSLRARWPRWLLMTAWGCTIAILVPMMMYYNNGWWQINAQRFSMDFVPVLMLLTGVAARDGLGNYWKGAIVWAVFLNLLAWVIIPVFA